MCRVGIYRVVRVPPYPPGCIYREEYTPHHGTRATYPAWYPGYIPTVVHTREIYTHRGAYQGGLYPPWFPGCTPTMVLRLYTHHGTLLAYPPWYTAGIPTMVGRGTYTRVVGIPAYTPREAYTPLYPGL